jgi:type I restriction enzyme S subunit
MKRYDSYRDSGDEWIEQIPTHWETQRLKWLSNIENSGIWGEDEEFSGSISVPIPTTGQLSIEGIWNYEKMSIRHLTEDEWEKYKCVEGDIVVVKSSGSSTNIITGKCGYISQSDSECFGFSNFLLRVRPTKLLDKLVYYFLSSNVTKQRIERMVSSTTYPNLKVDEYSNSILSVPPLSEQQQIVSFLDSKTSQIDELIQKKERKIELLKEYRTSLINQVVTKGLNPNVEMKDSVVEWIGEIPSHWVVLKIKYGVNHLTEKGTPGKDDIKISPENVESETGVCFNLYSEHDSEGVFFEKGDVLFNKLRLYLKKILLTDYDGFSLGEMIVLRTNDKLINKYFYQLLFSQGLIDLLDSQSTGIKLPRVSPDVILNTEITYPPLSEQQQIVEYLDEQTQKIDSSIQTEERKIELLKEYRQSLISSVVTGKIDVRPDKEIPWFQKPEPKVTVHKLKTPRNGIEEIVVTTPPIWEEKVFDIVLENLTIINSLCSSEIQFKLVSNYIIPVGYKPNNCILLFKDKKLNGVYYELKSWDSHKEWETTDGIFYEIIDEKIVEKDIVDRIFYWQFKELEKEGYNSYFIYYSKDRELMKTFSELKNIQLND